MDAHDGICEIAICVAPELTNLEAFRVKVGPQLLEEYLSFHNAVTTVVRCLAVNNPEILACPGWNEDDMLLVMSRERAKETGWREVLASTNLEIVEDRKTVTPELFANCVWYTIMCRMAPEWNRAGHLLVQGCDFLTNMNNRKYRALEMKVAYLPSARLKLVLMAYTVTFNQLTPAYFANDPSATAVINGLEKSSIFTKDQQRSRTCYVLPRQTMGIIRKLSKSLPPSTAFGNYAELREYWKDMYGYCLPAEDPAFYCNVVFLGPSRTMFTYPSCCLLSAPMEVSRANDTDWMQCIKAFTTDLYVKVPVLCGAALKLVHKPQSATR